MPKLQFDDGTTIDITDRQAVALDHVFATMKPTGTIMINGKQYQRSTVLGIVVPEVPIFGTKATLKPKPIKKRTINRLPEGVTLPEKLLKLFDAGDNVDWYFHKNRK